MPLFPPPPAITPLPEEKVDSTYKRYRLQVFSGIFIGYAAFYLLRTNFSLAMPHLLAQTGPDGAPLFSKAALGLGGAGMSIAYGLSKFVMGTVSDRSNARLFLSFSLILTAALTLLAGTPWCLSTVWSIFTFQLLIGWFGACGWPSCGRVMTHWFSLRERGMTIATWNVAHNVGGALLPWISAGVIALIAYWYGEAGVAKYWQFGVFYVPALLAMLVAFLAWLMIRDTPQSCGLPSIEVYKNDFPPAYSKKDEQELTTWQIMRVLFSSRALWFAGLANIFIYLLRYGLIQWAPTYLEEMKGFTTSEYSFAYGLYEFAAIPGTLICGWMSDKLFRGRHALTGIVFMGLSLVCLLVYWLCPLPEKWIYMAALIGLGFLVYGPVMLIGVIALEIAPKKASGSAGGMMSFFGYFIGTSLFANIVMGWLAEIDKTWNYSFLFLAIGTVLSMLFLMVVWYDENRRIREQRQATQEAKLPDADD